MNKKRIPLLALCIGLLKTSHDSGKSKVYFIIPMLIVTYASTLDYIATVLFLLPLVPYAMETGYLHKLNKTNTPRADWKLWGYAYFITLCFMAPFAYTTWWYSLPLLLWPVMLRYLVIANSKWWWVCTFTLFFSYTLLYLYSAR